MLGGVLFNAIVHDKVISQVFTVTSTDWLAVTQAMKSLDIITNKIVQTEIEEMMLITKGKEKTFWVNMYECY